MDKDQILKELNLEAIRSVLAKSTTERATFRVDKYSNLDEFLLMVYESICAEDGVCERSEELVRNIHAISVWMIGEAKVSLMLSGNCGNGKTTMMRMIQRSVPMLTRNQWKVYMTNALDAVDMAQNSEQDFKRALTAQILALDDVGIEPSVVKRYGNELSPITDIIYYRYDRRMPTIISTNLRKSDFESVYGERIADRVNGFFTNIVFKNPSYRR